MHRPCPHAPICCCITTPSAPPHRPAAGTPAAIGPKARTATPAGHTPRLCVCVWAVVHQGRAQGWQCAHVAPAHASGGVLHVSGTQPGCSRLQKVQRTLRCVCRAGCRLRNVGALHAGPFLRKRPLPEGGLFRTTARWIKTTTMLLLFLGCRDVFGNVAHRHHLLALRLLWRYTRVLCNIKKHTHENTHTTPTCAATTTHLVLLRATSKAILANTINLRQSNMNCHEITFLCHKTRYETTWLGRQQPAQKHPQLCYAH